MLAPSVDLNRTGLPSGTAMITIGGSPPTPSVQSHAETPKTVTELSAVPVTTNQKQKRDGQDEARDEGELPPETASPEELSDELLLKVVRALSGERGVIVDKKV